MLSSSRTITDDADIVTNAYSRADDELERHLERELAAVLGEEAWEREKTAGSAMTLEQAIALAQCLSGVTGQAVAVEFRAGQKWAVESESEGFATPPGEPCATSSWRSERRRGQ